MSHTVAAQPEARVQPTAAPRGTWIRTVPRQHGAWSVLLASYALGALVGGRGHVALVPLLVAVLTGFLARHASAAYVCASPVRRDRNLLFWAAAYGFTSVLTAALVVLLWDRWWLVAVGTLVVALGATSVILECRGSDRSAAGELLAMAGLATAVPAAAYSARGAWDLPVVGAWALAVLFFCGAVLHVRFVTRQRAARGGPLVDRLRAGWPSLAWHLGSVAVVAGLWLLAGWPGLAPLALAPAAIRAARAAACPYRGPLAIRRVGFSELAHSVLFVALAAAAFG